MKLKVLDTFSGIGGFSFGLEATGFYETAAFCENNPACQYWLSKRWPSVPIFHDIKHLAGTQYRGKIDLITGGFPCQDISVAGDQKGLGTKEDPTRSGLFYQLVRVISEVRPRWILLENVAALKNQAYDTVHDELERIDYTCWPTVVSAENIGADHRRERVWIVGCDKQQLGYTQLHGLLAATLTRGFSADVCDDPQRPDEALQSQGASTSRELADSFIQFLQDALVRNQEWRESANQSYGATELAHAALQVHDRGSRSLDEEATGWQGLYPSVGTGSDDDRERPGLVTFDYGDIERQLITAEYLCGIRDQKLYVADTVSTGLQGWVSGRPDQEWESVYRHIGRYRPSVPARWPARPGEIQHAWEEPRLTPLDGAKRGLGGAIDGLPKQLSTLGKVRKEQLTAYGNAIVPWIAYLWGQVLHDMNNITKGVE